MQLTPSALHSQVPVKSPPVEELLGAVARQKHYTRIDMLVQMTKFEAKESHYKKEILQLQTQLQEQRKLNEELCLVKMKEEPEKQLQNNDLEYLVIVREIQSLVSSVLLMKQQIRKVEQLTERIAATERLLKKRTLELTEMGNRPTRKPNNSQLRRTQQIQEVMVNSCDE